MNGAYRLCSIEHPADTGYGASLRGGRWNPVGVKVIYSSTTVSLAVLEILVHFSVLPENYALSEIAIPDRIAVEYLPDNELPIDWDKPEYGVAARELGARWIADSRTPVLSVPSSVVRTERNMLINPAHCDFKGITFLKPPQPFTFDPRLK